MTRRLDIVHDGDVVLRLLADTPVDQQTDEQQTSYQELRVSSRILCQVSPIFQIMFRGPFREGIELAEAKAAAKNNNDSNSNNTAVEQMPIVVNLPGDDAEAMTYFCQLAHFKASELSMKPRTEFIEKMAFLCDKYMCPRLIQACGAAWLRNWLGDCDKNGNCAASVEDLCRLFVFTYVVDLFREEFSRVSWLLFLRHRGPLSKMGSTAERMLRHHPLLREDAIEYLDGKRLYCCRLLHAALSSWKEETNDCPEAARSVNNYISHLYTRRLSLYSLYTTDLSISDLFKLAPHSPLTCCQCQGGNSCVGLYKKVARAGWQARMWQPKFVCLLCLKTNGQSFGRGKCWPFHANTRGF